MTNVGADARYPCAVFVILGLVSLRFGRAVLLLQDRISATDVTPDVINTALSKDSLVFTGNHPGNASGPNFFHSIHFEDNALLVGARNVVYNISMATFKETRRITWSAAPEDIQLCLLKQKTPLQCENYIQVIVRKNTGDFLVCGTNAFRPLCRTYQLLGQKRYYSKLDEESGIARCPYDPAHKSTAVYAGKRLFTSAVADLSGRDYLLYSRPLRTEQHDSQWLNEPNFVSSFPYGDKVYFFFRETAVENINCGKAVFSRVARVCMNDAGGARVLRNTWTSFSKARLNCSIPGDFPFYFDELQSTTDIGDGNVFPTLISNDRVAMVYAVFTTPRNSLRGAAVCAFKFSDIISSFEGPYKEQRTALSNWLPVRESDVPDPHPGKSCANESLLLSDQTLNFIKSHPLMDKAVPAFGGQPILIQTSFNFSFTQIAVDWQVVAADRRFYDILFVGTDDGKIYKVINQGRGEKIETVIIEVLSVFSERVAVTKLTVYHNEAEEQHKLIAVSRDEIRSIPLNRCHLKNTCSECVSLRDPYCSWLDGACADSHAGIQSIETGRHSGCPADPVKKMFPLPQTTISRPTCMPCTTPPVSTAGTTSKTTKNSSTQISEFTTRTSPDLQDENDKTLTMEDPLKALEHGTLASSGDSSYNLMFVITLILCILVALAIGFAAGYCVGAHRRLASDEYRVIRKECADDMLNGSNRCVQSSSSVPAKLTVQNQYDLEPHSCSDKCHPPPQGVLGKQCNVFANVNELNSARTVSPLNVFSSTGDASLSRPSVSSGGVYL